MGSYGGFDFKGYSCANSFGKRGGGASMGGSAPSSGFQSKCITGSAGQSSGPSFSCSSHEFSIDHMQVTPEHDTNLECHYTMPDNSICKSTHSCSSKGTTIQNSQCGGAKAVSIVVPSAQPTPTCSFAIHSVGFNCGTASYTPPAPTTSVHPSTSAVSSAKSVHTESSSTEVGHTSRTTTIKQTTTAVVTSKTSGPSTTTISYSSVTSVPVNSVPASSVPASSAPQSSSPVLTTSASVSSSLSVQYSMPQNSSMPQSSSPVFTSSFQPSVVTTEIIYTTTTSCSSGHEVTTVLSSPSLSTVVTSTAKPVVSTPTSGPPVTVTSYETFTTTSSCSAGQTVKSTLTAPSVITTTLKSTTVVSVTAPPQIMTTGGASAPVSSAPASSASVPAHAAPSVLPRCLNSFPATGCNGNTDSSCYCKDAQFITNAITCANSHGANHEEIAQAISYLQGICAPHIPQNPAIITAVPTTITVSPVPASTAAPVASGPVTQAPAMPMTTVTLSTTVTMPCSACESASSVSVINTVITCPQVSFATGSASSVSLMPATTFAAPTGSTVAPAPAPAPISASTAAPVASSVSAPVYPVPVPISVSTAAPVASSVSAPVYPVPGPSASAPMSAPAYPTTDVTSPVQTVPAGIPAYGGTGTGTAYVPYATGSYGVPAAKPLAYAGAAVKNTAGGILGAFGGIIAMIVL